ncbi:chemotaxis protein CheW [Fodinicurvata sp. EGI_FJ10296]|uniref:chemotaxis protein CheW n=1 Tax=Fodinicurvata sp. EGI_FJ10296 TaxID=3231908 RepID=UPI003453BE35
MSNSTAVSKSNGQTSGSRPAAGSIGAARDVSVDRGPTTQFVTMTLADQLFGIPTEEVQDVHRLQSITPIPLAPPEIAGALNIRGKIVTAVDLRRRLGLPTAEKKGKDLMSIVAEYNDHLYSLLIDEIGEVMSLPDRDVQKNASTMDVRWREISEGIYRLDGRLMVRTSVAKLLNFMH